MDDAIREGHIPVCKYACISIREQSVMIAFMIVMFSVCENSQLFFQQVLFLFPFFSYLPVFVAVLL